MCFALGFSSATRDQCLALKSERGMACSSIDSQGVDGRPGLQPTGLRVPERVQQQGLWHDLQDGRPPIVDKSNYSTVQYLSTYYMYNIFVGQTFI